MIPFAGGLVLWILCLAGHLHLLLALAMHWAFRLGDRPLRTALLISDAVLCLALAGTTLALRGFPEFWAAPPQAGSVWAYAVWLWQWASTALGCHALVAILRRGRRAPVACPAVLGSAARLRHVDPALMQTAWGKVSVRAGFGALEVNEYTVVIPGLPDAFHGLMIAHVSDLHAGRETARRLAEMALEEVHASGADLVALTGDFVGPGGTLEMAVQQAGEFRAPMGAYAVLGNHDLRMDAAQVTRALETQGITVLRNQGLRLRPAGDDAAKGLWLAGVDDFWDHRSDLAAALAGREPGEPCILLAHNPDQIIEAAERGVDLQLSGHTHGGQIAPPATGPLFVPSRHGVRFARGLHQVGEALVYVSRGVAGGPAIRVGAKPELALLRLAARGTNHEQD